MNKNMWALAFVIALAGFTGCDKEKNALAKGQIKDIWAQASDTQFIRTRGIGAVPKDAKDVTQARGMARNAGLLAARYEMLQRLRGLRLSGGLTVQELMQTDSQIAERADDIIRGAEELSCEFAADGGAVVVIQVRRSDVEKLSRAR